MKGNLLCLPCTVRTAYDIATKATENEDLQKKIIVETLRWLAEDPQVLESTPTVFHTRVFRLAQRITGNRDPFRALKTISNEIALKVLPILEREFKSRDSRAGFRLAALGTICGNTIDFEVEGYTVSAQNIERSLISCLKEDFDIDDTSKFIDALARSHKVLYLLDNAGEIVFDKFFIKVIRDAFPVRVWAVVKDGPILNDATIEDASQVKLDEVARVITTGNDHIGLKLNEVSEDFRRCLQDADLIISKGQGNYESLYGIEHLLSKPIVYILRAKCVLVARMLGVTQHANVVELVT